MEKIIDVETMTKYLKQVMDIECSLYEQEQGQEIACSNAKYIQPYMTQVNEPVNGSRNLKRPTEPVYESTSYLVKKILKRQIFVMVYVLFLLPGMLSVLSYVGTGFFAWMLLVRIMPLLIVEAILVLPCVIKISKKKKANRELKKGYKNAMAVYNTKVSELDEKYMSDRALYEQKVEEAKEQYAKKCQIAQANYENAQSVAAQFAEPIRQTKEVLERLYAYDWIYPKYRNMVAVSTIYEYFASGRVSSLKGSDGAYNLYEAEIRQDRVVENLDSINNNLEQIKHNQYTLYSELQKSNELLRGIESDMAGILRKTDDILSNTQAIKESSHITECCAMAIERNTSAIANMMLFDAFAKA